MLHKDFNTDVLNKIYPLDNELVFHLIVIRTKIKYRSMN